MDDLIISHSDGLYCTQGDFFIDPWGNVETALITHAHSDHLRTGSKNYICSNRSEPLVKYRLGSERTYELKSYPYKELFEINGVTISFHPSGHILGSAQIRLEYNNEVWVLTGDYKHQPDPTCEPFQQLQADVLITEATFGLPIYHWKSSKEVFDNLMNWWDRNAEEGQTSKLFGYSLGKTQRILAELKKRTDKTAYIHGALDGITQIYRNLGVPLLDTELVVEQDGTKSYEDDLVISPPGAFRSNYMKRFKNFSSAFASGWMRVRGRRRMGGFDTGFVISDHADWPALLQTVKDSGASRIMVGFTKSPVFVRYLNEELGYDATQLDVKYTGEDD